MKDVKKEPIKKGDRVLVSGLRDGYEFHFTPMQVETVTNKDTLVLIDKLRNLWCIDKYSTDVTLIISNSCKMEFEIDI